MIFFDIETEGLPLEVLKQKLAPFDPSSLKGLVTGEFDPSSVKLGNMKDQAKIDEKIAAAKAKHEEAVAKSDQMIAEGEQAYWDGIVERAALSATTGKVLVIGFYDDDSDKVTALAETDQVNEAAVLRSFWQLAEDAIKNNQRMCGLNIFAFDLPFLIRRSWILDVDVPASIVSGDKYVKWNPIFLDLRERWQLGDRQAKSSFDELGRAFGTGGKPDGVNGGDFARLWRDDRETAKQYLINDLKQPAQWALRMNA